MKVFKKIQVFWVFLGVTFFISENSFAQTTSTEEKIYNDGVSFMRQEMYNEAMDAFQYIRDYKDVPYKSAICVLLGTRFRNQSISRFLQFENEMSKDPMFYYWKGMIYLKSFSLPEAMAAFAEFKEKSKGSTEAEVVYYQKRSKNLMGYIEGNKEDMAFTPFESPINSRCAEPTAFFSADEKELVFATDRDSAGYFKIYQTSKGLYGWDTPGQVVESTFQPGIINILPVRDAFAYFQPEQASLQVLELTDGKWTLSSQVQTSKLEGAQHIYINKYKTRILFSKENGESMLDIYETMKLRSTGEWLESVPVSYQINGPYNEDYPYLTDDRMRLYFSSDRPGGVGRVDIYYSDFNEAENKWGSPINAGMPINSIDNDLNFRMINETMGMLSSDRTDAVGDLDLYIFEKGGLKAPSKVNLSKE